ncbi:uncharacterized protein [Amphiura filiformis]|uniref:uncharacterized protein isoform X2 n=1 Tax=Amphiura filiformis TaxID=82378 RepID=UPI003B2222AB
MASSRPPRVNNEDIAIQHTYLQASNQDGYLTPNVNSRTHADEPMPVSNTEEPYHEYDTIIGTPATPTDRHNEPPASLANRHNESASNKGGRICKRCIKIWIHIIVCAVVAAAVVGVYILVQNKTTKIKDGDSNDSPTSVTTKSSHVTGNIPTVCIDKLGMENGDIPDGSIQASSFLQDPFQATVYYPAKDGRLNGGRKWVPEPNDPQPWIQADIGYATNVFGVITQGSGRFIGLDGTAVLEHWTTLFKVSTFLSTYSKGERFIMDHDGNVEIFPGNYDINSAVTRMFPEPVYARIVRITCLDGSDNTYLTLRFEILGCKGP